MKNPKIVPLGKLIPILHCLQKHKKVVVFTNGCFDLMHAGHVKYLKKARSLGDTLVVGVNTDASVRRLKGAPRPLMKLGHRLEVLSALQVVDYLLPFGQSTPEALIRRLKPDILVKGADYNTRGIAGSDFVKNSGGRVMRIPLVKGLSTSGLVARIRDIP